MATPFVWRTAAAWAGDLRPPQLNTRLARMTSRQLQAISKADVFSSVLPFFDLSWPWHWDYSCSDGMHYGLTGPPSFPHQAAKGR